MSSGFEFQEKFVTQLKSIIASNIGLADELAMVLNLSTDSVYRRLRCQSAFSLDEVAIISKKFGVSVDGMLNLDELQVNFHFNPMFEEPTNFQKYLKWFADYLIELSQIQGLRVIYAAEDVPLFRHFNFPNLSAFKSYYWTKAVLHSDFFKAKKYTRDIVSDEILAINKQAYVAYSQINSVEIWTEETLTSSLKQVEFFWESDLFENKDQAILVINDIRYMLDELRTDCENSYKNHPSKRGQFTLFNSEVMIGNNCVLIEASDSNFKEQVFLGHNTFNNLSTHNAAFARETRLWMDNLSKKSLQLSGTAEKQRARFFKKMYEKVDALIKNIAGEATSN
ncbi:MAG: helix-turn-helix domain-containing protein [Chitinophagales bacterium]